MPASDPRLLYMSFPEVAAAIAGGSDHVLIPCAAVEQHGPHLPLSVDADHADRLALMIAERLGRTLVAPTIMVGCSDHHLEFAGSLSLRKETFEAVCTDYCRSLSRHGVRRISLFSAHAGNFGVLADMLPRLQAAVGEVCEVDAFTDVARLVDTWRRAVVAAGGPGERVGGHADIAETSFMLVLRPESVRTDRMGPGRLGVLTDAERTVMRRDGLRKMSPNGILGDPRGASAAIGERCMADVADMLAEAFRR